MLVKTHIVIGLAVALYFLPHVNNKLVFFPVVLIATLLPNIGHAFPFLGKKSVFRPAQTIFKHRGIIHSFTLAIALSIIIALSYPVIALPFFLGYSFHLLADAYTSEGIKPYWPFKWKSQGPVKVGSITETSIFYIFIIFDVALLVKLFV